MLVKDEISKKWYVGKLNYKSLKKKQKNVTGNQKQYQHEYNKNVLETPYQKIDYSASHTNGCYCKIIGNKRDVLVIKHVK